MNYVYQKVGGDELSKYNKTIGIGKLGINFIKNIVDESECYFHEILQENDVGIDAFIEFTQNGENDGRCIAVQIKNGESYFNKERTICYIPIDNHFQYWMNHSLDVYGIVCDHKERTSFWVSISEYININKTNIASGKIKRICFPVMQINKLDCTTFVKIFRMIVYNSLPMISFEQAVEFSQPSFCKEKEIAIFVLMRKYANLIGSWDICFKMLLEETEPSLLTLIIEHMSYVSYNPDLWGDLDYSPETKDYGKKLIKQLDRTTIVKMLNLISEEEIVRGTIGQCVESLISIILNNENVLIEIINEYYTEFNTLNAFYILAYYNPNLVVKKRQKYEIIFGELASMVIDFIIKFHNYDLYV